MDKNKIIIFSVLGGVILVIILSLLGLFSGGDEDPRVQLEGELDFWGVFDEEVAYERAIDSFNSVYPNLKVEYRRFDSVESYERTLLDALAAGRGPDIFMVRNNDMARKSNKIYSVPSSKYSLINLRNQFPDIVEDNFAFDGQRIYALPLSIDTLSLIYNDELFASNDIVFAPETWTEFENTASKITSLNSSGDIKISGAAMGAPNIDRSKDILSLLMMQSGADMVDEDYSKALFRTNFRIRPAEFYTSFANPNSQNYSWNRFDENSLQAFKEGDVGMIVNYHSALSEIKSHYPYLDIKAAEVPQFGSDSNISYANYWGYTVSSQSEFPNAAWDFIINLTTSESNVRDYLNITNRPPALSVLVQEELNNPDMRVYASQILRAKSWPEPHPERVRETFDNMTESILDGDRVSSAINRAESEVTQMINEL